MVRICRTENRDKELNREGFPPEFITVASINARSKLYEDGGKTQKN